MKRAHILLFSLAALVPAVAQTPQYVAMPLNKRPAYSGCAVVQNLDALKQAVKALGYTSASLPVVNWTSGGAVIIVSNNGSLVPYSYTPPSGDSILHVITTSVPSDPKNYLFVMTIDKASAAATHCFLQDRLPASGGSVLPNLSPGKTGLAASAPPGTRTTAYPTLVKGGSSTTTAVTPQ
jgi:hypothetical protein